MARYSSGMTATIAGTTVRPIFGLLSTASVAPVLREVGVFNTTATSCIYRLVSFTGGTAGADQVERKHRRAAPAATCVAKAGWTADVTSVDEDTGYRAILGAAIGSAAILTFGAEGLENPVGSTIGWGLIPVGTGQLTEVYFVWDE